MISSSVSKNDLQLSILWVFATLYLRVCHCVCARVFVRARTHKLKQRARARASAKIFSFADVTQYLYSSVGKEKISKRKISKRKISERKKRASGRFFLFPKP